MFSSKELVGTLAVLIVSVFVLGWWVGTATGAPGTCQRVYPAPDTFVANHGIRINATPAGIGFARCLRATGQR